MPAWAAAQEAPGPAPDARAALHLPTCPQRSSFRRRTTFASSCETCEPCHPASRAFDARPPRPRPTARPLPLLWKSQSGENVRLFVETDKYPRFSYHHLIIYLSKKKNFQG